MGDNRLRTYTKKERNMYLCGMFGQNMIYNIISAGLIGFYLQSVIYIPTLAIGIITGIARVWDAINDPMMGTFVDRTKSRWGKCRPYLFHVPSAVLIVTVLTFVNGQYSASNPASRKPEPLNPSSAIFLEIRNTSCFLVGVLPSLVGNGVIFLLLIQRSIASGGGNFPGLLP